MGTYAGTLRPDLVSDPNRHVAYFGPSLTAFSSRFYMDTSKSHGGNAALCLNSGGVKSIFAPADIGARTWTAYVWAPTGAQCGLELVDESGDALATEYLASGFGDWALLTLSHTITEKKYYVLRAVNYTGPTDNPADADCRVWFDDFE